MKTFDELGVPPRLAAQLRGSGITEPFPIQAASIPDAMAGHDILGHAPTGSGKTLAFGLPVLARVTRSEAKCPRALVLAPTRELAQQIANELIPLGKTAQRWVFSVYGGVGYENQRRQLRRGVDVLVATPGRLIDLIEEGTVSLRQAEIVVVDEADRMADMGFMPQVRKLLDMVPADRQTLLFSATLDGEVAELTRRYQTSPRRHEVEGHVDHGQAAHYFWRVEASDRVRMTAEIVSTSSPTLVFTRTRRGAERLARQLSSTGVKTESIHGGRSQNQRTRALAAFSSGKVSALIATDVAARGIHVDGVAGVVHFDLPDDPKDYLHRSGRTARAGTDGVVVSLVTGQQTGVMRQLQRAVGLAGVSHDPAEDWLTGRSGSRLDASAATAARDERRPGPSRGERQNQGGQRQNQGRNQGRNRRHQRSRSR